MKKLFFAVFWWFFFVPCVSFSDIWVQVRGLCLLSQPSDTLFFLICSLSAQCVRHFAPISSNLGSGPTKLTLVIFWNLEKKNISLLVLNDKSKYPPRHCLLMRPALFYFLIEFFKWKNCFLLFFDDFFCTHVSDFLAYGYRSEGCASCASPLTPFIFFDLQFKSSMCASFCAHFQ